MKLDRTLDFRSQVEGLLSEIRPGVGSAEVLLGTGARIQVFQMGRRMFFSVRSVVELVQVFGGVRDAMEIHKYLKAAKCVERLGELGDAFEHADLEVVCSNLLTNEMVRDVLDGRRRRDEEMNAYFGHVEHGSGRYQEEPNRVSGMYPFNGQWTDSIMDGILRNIYTSDGVHRMEREGRDSRMEKTNRERLGRGREGVSGSLEDRPFVCTYKDCKSAFKRYEHLKRHNLMHTGERPYRCRFPGCSKSFSRSDNLSQHHKVHSVDSMHTKNYKTYRYLNKEFN